MVPLMVPLNPPDKRHPLRGTPPVRSSGTKVRRSVHSAHAPPRAKLPTQTWGNTMGRILPLRYPVCVPRPCYARSRTGRFAGAPGCLMHGLRRGYWVRDGVAEGSYKRRPARSLWRPGGAGQVVAPAGAVGVAAAAGDTHTHSGTAARWIGGLVRLRKNPFRTPTLHHHPAGRSRQRTPPAHRPTPSLGQARRRLRAAADGWERCTRRRGSIPAMR